MLTRTIKNKIKYENIKMIATSLIGSNLVSTATNYIGVGVMTYPFSIL